MRAYEKQAGEALHPRHIEIEHKDGRMMTTHVASSPVHVAGFGDDLEVGLGVEQEAQPAAHDRMVVGDHDANRR